MTQLPLAFLPTPAPGDMAPEYVRIAKRTDGQPGQEVTRLRDLTISSVEVLALTCGGQLGKIIAHDAALTAARFGLIDVIYLDEDAV